MIDLQLVHHKKRPYRIRTKVLSSLHPSKVNFGFDCLRKLNRKYPRKLVGQADPVKQRPAFLAGFSPLKLQSGAAVLVMLEEKPWKHLDFTGFSIEHSAPESYFEIRLMSIPGKGFFTPGQDRPE